MTIVENIKNLKEEMEGKMHVLRKKHLYSSGYVSKCRGDMVMLLNKAQHELGLTHALFRRGPQNFIVKEGYMYELRPKVFKPLYEMGCEFTRRFSTRRYRFDLGLMGETLFHFTKQFDAAWEERRRAKSRRKLNDKLKHELRKPLFRGLRYELGGKKIAYISAIDEHESDEAFLKECLGPDWENVITMFTVQLFYFRANKALEPTVVSNIVWEEVL